MPVNDPDDLESVDRDIRINELRHKAEEAAGGEITGWESPDCPPEVAEEFWKNVEAFESAPETSGLDLLKRGGLELPAAAGLNDEQLHAKLWELIEAAAKRNIYFSQTDHLSDRELYEVLTTDMLLEPTKDLPASSGWVNHFDILGGCSEEDLQLQYKYYEDEESRERWLKQFPDFQMPDHVDPPHDRDRLLPQPPPPPMWIPPEEMEEDEEFGDDEEEQV